MSVSLIVLHLEIASDYPLLPHIHYRARKLQKSLLDTRSFKMGSQESPSEVEDLRESPSKSDNGEVKRLRGQREVHEITIESITDVTAYTSARNANTSSQPIADRPTEDPKSAQAVSSNDKSMAPDSGTNTVVTDHKSDQRIKEGKTKLEQPVILKATKTKTATAEKRQVTRPTKESRKTIQDVPVPVPKVDQHQTEKQNSKDAPLDEKEKLESTRQTIVVVDSQQNTEEESFPKGRTEQESSLRDVYPKDDRKSKGAQIPFMSGNHCVEITKGILHLYKENQRTPLEEEAERSEMLCILAIPSAMTTHDLLHFTAAVSADIEHMRIIKDTKPNQYMVLLKFRDQKAADVFYKNFNGVPFNSIEPETCHLVYVAKLETIKESEDSCLPLPGHTELPTCPVCLERMDESVEGILTILCNHSFHTGCLSKWGDTSCPVCRYCQTPELVPDNHCFGCGSQDSLWICLICGHVGCGRYVEGHAFKHYLNTQHTYAMQLGNNRVWDYAGDNYVHRLVQNKADGKPVEWAHNREDFRHEEKVDSIQLEYTYLLTSQLEAQRHFFEDQFKRMENEMLRQIEELKDKAKQSIEERRDLEALLGKVTRDKQSTEKKINQLTQKLSKALLELKEEAEMNACLRQNQQTWQERLSETEKQLRELKTTKEEEVLELKDQVRDLMFYVEAQNKLQQIPDECRQEIQEGHIVMADPAEPSGSGNRRRRKR